MNFEFFFPILFFYFSFYFFWKCWTISTTAPLIDLIATLVAGKKQVLSLYLYQKNQVQSWNIALCHTRHDCVTHVTLTFMYFSNVNNNFRRKKNSLLFNHYNRVQWMVNIPAFVPILHTNFTKCPGHWKTLSISCHTRHGKVLCL